MIRGVPAPEPLADDTRFYDLKISPEQNPVDSTAVALPGKPVVCTGARPAEHVFKAALVIA